jgi:hypothetical protein
VSTEHKGPLAAFIVVAVIAGILLVTSVRSQAATGWLIDQLPTAAVVVSAPGAATDGLIAAIGSVDPGAVLVPKADAGTPPVTQTAPQSTAHSQAQASQPTTTVTHTATTHHATTHHATTHQATTHQATTHHVGHIGGLPPAHHYGQGIPVHGHGHGQSHAHGHGNGHGYDHGRHLGWDKRHVHGAR